MLENEKFEYNNDSENKAPKEEMTENVIQNSENREKGGEDNLEISENQEKTAPEEEKAADKEKEADSGEAVADREEAGADREDTERGIERETVYSTTYTPPLYVPDTSGSDNSEEPQNVKKEKKEKKKYGVGVVVSVSLVSIVLAIIAGTVSGVASALLTVERINSYNATIIRNDGSITVKKEVGSTGYSDLTYAQVYSLVSDSVVDISAGMSGSGSGVIISKSGNLGYIVTNNHVVDDSDSFAVKLTNGKRYAGTVIGTSPEDDLAVMTITVEDEKELSPAIGGHYEHLSVGDEVLAIGNPLGNLAGSATNGIISSLERNVTVNGTKMRLMQTNAEVNPGNSGGGLFNMAGELVGIVNAKIDEDAGEGLGFAIPYDDETIDKIAELIQYGEIRPQPALRDIEVEEVEGRVGIYTTKVPYNTSTRYGLQVGDRILYVNGIEVNTVAEYKAALAEVGVGNEAYIWYANYYYETRTTTAYVIDLKKQN